MNENIRKIRKKLFKAYRWWQENEEDQHCKSAEGTVDITICYHNYFDDITAERPPNYYIVAVYSYVFGPNRRHEFEGKTLEEASAKALKAVQQWTENYAK